MKYLIWGDNLPAVTIELDRGESIYTQSGGMSWMTDGISMETNARGGLGKALGECLVEIPSFRQPILHNMMAVQ